ncbi:MAG: nuclease [Cytophagaceae bacterium]|nr:nuclease [Cytophagaceae bacterium]
MKTKTTLCTYLTCFFLILFTASSLRAQLVTAGNDDGSDGTLRSEISDTPEGGVVTFAPGVTMAGLTSQITITKNITITGNGLGTTTIDGNDAARIFFVIAGKTLTINDLTITNGADLDGGAIFVSGGTLNMTSVEINNSKAYGSSGSGGAIYLDEGSNFMAMNASFMSNRANRAGGAIEDNSGDETTISIANSMFSDNNAGVSPAVAAPGNGGAIHITGAGNMDISFTDFMGNMAAREGGALWNGAGLMTVDNSEISGNFAYGDAADDGGAGIFNNGGDLTVSSSNISTNGAEGASASGGAILSLDGTVAISGSTINANYANRAGGGIELVAGSLNTTGTDFTDNYFMTGNPGNGGALHVTGEATISIVGGEVSGNIATSEGGGLWNQVGSTMTVDGVNITGNTAMGAAADNGGGGIFNNGGTLSVVNNTMISGNMATGASGSGGALFSTAGDVTVLGSTLFNNRANRAGGAIEIIEGSLTVSSSELNQNGFTTPAPGNGGALHVSGSAMVEFNGGTVSDNVAASEGGGLWNQAGATMIVSGTQILSNTASGNDADNGGGGIFNNGGTLEIANATLINGNMATGTSGSGGGVFSTAGDVTITGATLSQNMANRAGGAIEIVEGSLNIGNSALSDNGFTAPAPGNGGALHVTGVAMVSFDGGSVTGNMAASEGGGLWNQVGATMTVSGTEISGNTAEGDAADNGGGGIFNNGGDLTVKENAMITGNFATGNSGSGGGIQNVDGGTVTVMASTISQNVAMRAGGGIEDNSSNAAGTITLMDVALSENTTASAPGNGGGLHVTGPGAVMITGGTINDNMAANEGGGLWNGSGTMTVSGTAIMGNTASGATISDPLEIKGGGGIFANDGGTLIINEGTVISGNFADGAGGSGGGVLMATTSTLTINGIEGSPVIFSGNAANRAGGAIEDWSLEGTTSTLMHVDFTGNSAGVAIEDFTPTAAPGNGGAIHISGTGSMNITGGMADGNMAAAEGGAFWNSVGTMMVDGVDITNNVASGAAADNGGGGLFNNGGSLTVMNSLISRNTADGASGSGGGIQNVAGGMLMVADTEISFNEAMRAGGGIEDNSTESAGSITLTDVALENNMTGAAPGNGGALHITGPGMATITGGTVNDNTAANEGGGLWNGSGTMTINGTMFTGNVASGATIADPLEIKGGGAIFANDGGTLIVNAGTSFMGNYADGAGGSGGGILMATTSALQINGTIENPVIFELNAANRAGGAIEDWSLDTAISTLTNVDFSGNSAGVSMDGFTATAAPGNGGAIHISGAGSMMITGGTAMNNMAAAEGGAFWNSVGMMTLDEVMVMDNVASGADATNGGGGLFNNGGQLEVQASTVSNNIANGASGSGGGIQNVDGGTLTVLDSEISSNTAMRAGGGIEDNSSTASGFVTITNSTVADNTTGSAPGNGGGFHITGPGNALINSSTFNGNYAANEGGGIWNGAGSMNIMVSTISGNMTDGDGGGVFNLNGSLLVNASTIAMNTAAGVGGGIDNAANSPTTTFTNTLIAMNTASSGMDLGNDGVYTSSNYNLVGIDDLGSLSAQANDQVGTMAMPVDPLLDVLADNGGSTMTHALLEKSPAYNGDNPVDGFTDQIGQAVFDGVRDIGAFEAQVSLGIEDNLITGISGSKLYPNPVMTGEVKINIPQSISNENVAVKIYEVGTGKLVYDRLATSGVNTLQVNNLAAGTYIVQLVHHDNVQNLKMVVGR